MLDVLDLPELPLAHARSIHGDRSPVCLRQPVMIAEEVSWTNSSSIAPIRMFNCSSSCTSKSGILRAFSKGIPFYFFSFALSSSVFCSYVGRLYGQETFELVMASLTECLKLEVSSKFSLCWTIPLVSIVCTLCYLVRIYLIDCTMMELTLRSSFMFWLRRISELRGGLLDSIWRVDKQWEKVNKVPRCIKSFSTRKPIWRHHLEHNWFSLQDHGHSTSRAGTPAPNQALKTTPRPANWRIVQLLSLPH